MAKQNTQDVELRISAITDGVAQVKTLADQIDALAREGGNAAPQFKALAEELRKIGAQADTSAELGKLEAKLTDTSAALEKARADAQRLNLEYQEQQSRIQSFATAQTTAKTALEKTQAALREAVGNLRTYRAETDNSTKKTDEYKNKVRELQTVVANLRNAQAEQGAAYRKARDELKAANDELNKAESAYNKANSSAEKLAGNVSKQNAALQKATDAAQKAGVEVLDLATAQERVNAATADAIQRRNELAATEERLARIAQAAGESNAKLGEQLNRINADRENAARLALAQEEALLAVIRQGNDAAVDLAKKKAAERERAAAATREETSALKENTAELLRQKLAEEQYSAAIRASQNRAVAQAEAAAAKRVAAAKEAAAAEVEASRQSEAALLREKLAREQFNSAIAASQARAVAQAEAAAARREAAARRAAAAEAAAARETEFALYKQELAQQEVAASAKAAADAISNAFGTVGVRSAQQIQSEIDEINRSLITLRNSSGVTGAEFNRAFQNAQQRVEELQRELRGLPPILQQTNALTGALRQSMSQLTAAFGAFEIGRAFITANNQFETLRRTLTLITGTSEGAARQIEFLRNTANNAGLSVGALTQDFVNFSAAANSSGIALETQREVFAAVANAAGQLGLSTDRVGLILQALSQTANKGKLSLEELQGQLGESLPGALSIVARGFGVTNERLLELVKNGVSANDFFAAFISGTKQAFGQGEQQVQSFAAAFNRLRNAFNEFATRAADTGPFRLLVSTIDLLAQNFDTVANTALLAGQAFAAFKVAQYVKDFTGLSSALKLTAIEQAATTVATQAATAAKVTDTVATQANTTAVAANTVAQVANRTAVAGAVGTLAQFAPAAANAAANATLLQRAGGVAATSIGLLGTAARGAAALVGGLPGVLALVALNAQDLGKWIGEGIAKLQGYGEALEEAERRAAAEAKAAEDAAKAARELAEEKRKAAQAALGLSGESAKLVDKFDEVAKKAKNSSEALAELSKELRFDDLSGIRAAGVALNALAEQGKLSADQIKQAYATALDGQDLLKFETNAMTAFANIRGGAEQLKIVVDALGEESLKRAGTSVNELRTGFSSAMNSAINDTDRLSQTLRNLNATTEQSSNTLSVALNKEVELATTRRGIDEIITRIQEFGTQGQLAGVQYEQSLVKAINKAIELGNTDQDLKKLEEQIKTLISLNPQLATAFAGSMETLKKKIEEVNPALRQLEADAKRLGVQIGESTNGGVNASIQAYERLKLSGKLTGEQLQQAFINVANEAIKAANGQIPEWVKVEAAIRGVSLETLNLGKATTQTVATGIDGLERLGDRYDRLRGQIEAVRKEDEKWRQQGLSGDPTRGAAYNAQGYSVNTQGQQVNALGNTWLSIYNQLKSRGLDDADAQRIASEFAPNGQVSYFASAAQIKYGGRNGTLQFAVDRAAEQVIKSRGSANMNLADPFGLRGTNAAEPVGGQSYTVNINLGGRSTTINTASAADAQNLTNLLRQIGDAANRTGP